MATSISNNNIHNAFAKESEQIKDNFAAMDTKIATTFENSGLQSISVEAGVIAKNHEETASRLKTNTIDASKINDTYKDSKPQQDPTESLDDKLKSTQEITADFSSHEAAKPTASS